MSRLIKAPPLQAEPQAPKEAPPPPAPVAAKIAPPATNGAHEESFWEVMRSAQVSRGASTYTLPAGKVISSRGYNIDELRNLGVPMERRGSGKTPPRAILSG